MPVLCAAMGLFVILKMSSKRVCKLKNILTVRINEKITPDGVVLSTKESMDVSYGNSVLQEWFPSLFGRRKEKKNLSLILSVKCFQYRKRGKKCHLTSGIRVKDTSS